MDDRGDIKDGRMMLENAQKNKVSFGQWDDIRKKRLLLGDDGGIRQCWEDVGEHRVVLEKCWGNVERLAKMSKDIKRIFCIAPS
jgi:hypothetical protein